MPGHHCSIHCNNDSLAGLSCLDERGCNRFCCRMASHLIIISCNSTDRSLPRSHAALRIGMSLYGAAASGRTASAGPHIALYFVEKFSPRKPTPSAMATNEAVPGFMHAYCASFFCFVKAGRNVLHMTFWTQGSDNVSKQPCPKTRSHSTADGTQS